MIDETYLIENIAKNLRELRKEKNLTQEEVISKIRNYNLSLRSLKSYESGKSTRIPSLLKINILADFYNVSVDYIMSGKKSIYDSSFQKGDLLKQLCKLVYSFTLVPTRETDEKSQYYGKYYFVSGEPDVLFLFDQLNAYFRRINYDFETLAINKYKGFNDFENFLNKIESPNEDWSPSLNRLNHMLELFGEDPQQKLNEKLCSIKRKRNNGRK